MKPRTDDPKFIARREIQDQEYFNQMDMNCRYLI